MSEAVDLACWSCREKLGAAALFCHACGAVQPPGQADHFRRLGLAPHFDLDLDRLESQYLAFQRALHPDRFAARSARERAIAEQQAASLNEAWRILQDPVRRAAYLLELRGRGAAAAGSGTLADQTILTEAMEWREKLMEAADEPALRDIAAKAGAAAIALLAELGRAFADNALDAAERLTLRLRYLRKFLEDAKARLAALDA